jgi:hypothetical protein
MEADFRLRQGQRLTRFQTRGRAGRIGAAALTLRLDEREARWRLNRRILLALLAALSIASLEIAAMSDGLFGKAGGAGLARVDMRGWPS